LSLTLTVAATEPALPTLQVVAAVLHDGDGRVLVSLRPAGKPQAGFWEFPGGKLGAGESAADALQRELREELGIEVQRSHEWMRLEHDYPDKHVALTVWTVSQYTGTVRAMEAQQLRWVTRGELQQLQLLPADGPIVEQLLSDNR
jgi:8-oxo-dGTP diphosphatase